MSNQQNITQLELATQWLNYVVSNEQDLLDKLTKSNRYILRNSFQKAIQSNDPDHVISISLYFNKYLRYLDMGVGRGVPIGSRKQKSDFLKFRNTKGQLHKYNRKKIPVYNKPLTHQIKRLTELLSEQFNIKAITAIDSSLKDSINITI